MKNIIASAFMSMLVALLASCLGTVDETYTNALPIDASVVVRIDVSGLMKKAEYKDNRAINGAIGEMYSKTNSVTPAILDAISIDPEDRGVDAEAPIYYFIASDGFSTGLLMRVNNKEDVEKWLYDITATMGSASPSNVDLDDNHLLIYDQYRDVQWQMPASPVAQFNQSAAYAKMKKMDGEVRYSCNTKNLVQKHGFRAITSQPPIYTETWLVGAFSFDDGSCAMTTSILGKTPEAEAGIAAFKTAFQPSESKFIEYLPASTSILASVSGKGTDYLDYLVRTPYLESTFGRNHGMWKNLINAVDGEVVVALTGISATGISFIAYADLASGVTEKDLKETLTLYGMGNMHCGVNEQRFYLTSDETLASNAFKKASPSFSSEKYGKQAEGKPVYVLMDMEKYNENRLMQQALSQGEDQGPMQFLNLLSATEIELDKNHDFVMRINLKDKKENILKQVMNLLVK